MLSLQHYCTAGRISRSLARHVGWNAVTFLHFSLLFLMVAGENANLNSNEGAVLNGGGCAHGTPLAENEITQDDQCSSCDPGYQLKDKKCQEFKGECTHGNPFPVGKRTADNQCSSCDRGFKLNDKTCQEYEGECANGNPILPINTRTADNQCSSCDPGYERVDKSCKAFGGKCEHGHLVNDQSKRTADNQCGSCDPGYFMNHAKQCLPFGGKCDNGNLAVQNKRTQESHCGSCDPGYALLNKSCDVCAAGTYSNINTGGECKPCSDCQWSPKGASECNACEYVFHAIDTENNSNCELLHGHYLDWNCSFKTPPFIYLAASTSKLSHWQTMVDWLDKKFDVNMQDPDNLDRTPVVAAVEHCNESSTARRQMIIDLVIEKSADTLSGLPAVKAEELGCDTAWGDFLAAHPQGLNWWQQWEQSTSLPSFQKSLLTGFYLGLVAGSVFCHHCFQKCRRSEPMMNRGAWHLAAMAQYPPSSKRWDQCKCFLAVMANVIFPMNRCMSMVEPWYCLPAYVVLVWFPSMCIHRRVRGTWQFRKPALAALPLAYDLHETKAANVSLVFHACTSLRLIIFAFFTLLLVHREREHFQLVEDVTSLPFHQWYRLKEVLSLSSPMKLGDWIQNGEMRRYRNPMHLPRKVKGVPLRGIFYAFTGFVEIMSVFWCAMTLCFVLRQSYRKHSHHEEEAALLEIIDNQEETVKHLKELVEQIEKVEGCKLGELTVERELKEGMPGSLTERWERFCGKLKTCLVTVETNCKESSPSCMKKIWPNCRQRKTCLRFEVQPSLAEHDANDRRVWKEVTDEVQAAVPGATEIGVTDGRRGVFYIDLEEASLTGDAPSRLKENLSTQLKTVKTAKLVNGTMKIVEVSHVQPVTTFGLAKDLLFIGLDVITDALQIKNMYRDEFHILGGMYLFLFVSSLTAQIYEQVLDDLNVMKEIRNTLSNGFKTRALLKMVDREKGFEAFISLALSCYAVHWQVGAYSIIVSFVSIMFSSWGVATYIFNTVFLETAAERRMQGWRLGPRVTDGSGDV